MKLKFDSRLFLLPAFGLILYAADGRAGSPPNHFVKSSGMITDTKTGLIWQQTASSATYTRGAADTYCAGQGPGWRVPAAKELLTLVDTAVPLSSSVFIDTAIFSEVPVDKAWWSSTVVSSASSQSWAVDFAVYSNPRSEDGTTPLYVRCVK